MLITIFAPCNVHLLEVAGVRDAIFEANCKMASGHRYRVKLVTEQGVPEQSASGMTYVPDAGIRDVTEPCDTLIVAGPYGIPVPPSEAATQWLREQAQQSRRYGSTCTGAFLLAHAGLLAGRRATTHWQYAERLAADFPDILVEPDRIFVRDGPVFSSAGVTAAIDLAFSLIEEDHGRALALWVARRLVVFLKRPGGQSQFSAALTAQTATTSPIDRIRLHILGKPTREAGPQSACRSSWCESPPPLPAVPRRTRHESGCLCRIERGSISRGGCWKTAQLRSRRLPIPPALDRRRR